VAVTLEQVEHGTLQHEEADTDISMIVQRLLGEALELRAVDVERAEPPRRGHRRQRRALAVAMVERAQRPDIDGADAVAKGHAERAVVQIGSDPAKAAAGRRVDSGLDEGGARARSLPRDNGSRCSRHRW